MKFVVGDPVTLLCDRCGRAGIAADAVCAVGVGEVKVLHVKCSLEEHGFLTNGAARSLTATELASEISAALGV